MKLSRYFTAMIPKSRTWFVSGCVRNLGHVALERSLDKKLGTFEFFVADGFTDEFVALLTKLRVRGDIIEFSEHPNRFKTNLSS